MPETTLQELLDNNTHHAKSLPEGYFSTVEEVQSPAAVSICCSDSRVPQEGMWAVDEPGWLFSPSTIGNQVWDRVDGKLVVDGSVLYPIVYTNTSLAVVVGHTGCGAVTAALDMVREDTREPPTGVKKWIELLCPVIEDGLELDGIDTSDESVLIDQLVEYNVDRQVKFLLDSSDLPHGVDVFGFIYDFQGTYGEVRGRTYLVNANGVTDPEALRELVGDSYIEHVKRLV